MFLSVMAFFITLAGLIALFWANWKVAIVCLIAFYIVREADYRQRYWVLRDRRRVVIMDVLLGLCALLGILNFPLIGKFFPFVLAIVASVFLILYLNELLHEPGLQKIERTEPKQEGGK